MADSNSDDECKKQAARAIFMRMIHNCADADSEGESDKHGPQSVFWPNGSVKETITWCCGKRHGEHKQFWENGKLKYSANYDTGNRCGVETSYTEDGVKSHERNWAPRAKK